MVHEGRILINREDNYEKKADLSITVPLTNFDDHANNFFLAS